LPDAGQARPEQMIFPPPSGGGREQKPKPQAASACKQRNDPMKAHHAFPSQRVLTSALNLAGWLALAAVSSANAQPRYSITDLGTLPGVKNSFVNAWGGGPTINNRGHVAGFSTSFDTPFAWADNQAFLWTGSGRIEPLPGLPGTTETTPMAMNDRDQIVGWSGLDYPSNHGVLWQYGIAYALEMPDGYMSAAPLCINNAGTIVGVGSTPNFALVSAFVWSNLHIRLLPPLVEDAILTQANGINDRGQIVGVSGPNWWSDYHAVLWEGDAVTDLGTLGGVASNANAINNAGLIAGQSQVPNGDWHAALWRRGGIKDLGNFASDPYGSATGLNSRGQIVGVSSKSDGTEPHALLWEDGDVTNLQSLVPTRSGWLLQFAGSINDRGQIVGWGLNNGKFRAFLLTPAHGK
jgi:probable HAF family extracellular repeat protein